MTTLVVKKEGGFTKEGTRLERLSCRVPDTLLVRSRGGLQLQAVDTPSNI